MARKEFGDEYFAEDSPGYFAEDNKIADVVVAPHNNELEPGIVEGTVACSGSDSESRSRCSGDV